MKKLAKIALAATLLGGAAVAAAEPAQAGVHFGIGIGVPGPGPYYWHHDWCYYHPYRCGYGAPAYYYGGAAYPDGVFIEGRGYWWHGGWWGHRDWDDSGWHYRR